MNEERDTHTYKLTHVAVRELSASQRNRHRRAGEHTDSTLSIRQSTLLFGSFHMRHRGVVRFISVCDKTHDKRQQTKLSGR